MSRRQDLPIDLCFWKKRFNAARQMEGDDPATPSLVDMADELVQILGRRAGWDRAGRAVVALGGYGRRELAPRSDLDLLFLVRRGGDKTGVDSVLYPLWDLGFEVGHALRTPSDCAAMASSDLHAATALIDGRFLLGEPDLLEKARRRAGIHPGGSRAMRRWSLKILDDVESRRARFGDVSHLLEPHIKEGRGGLRDLHACRWVCACLGRDAEELSDRGIGEAFQFLARTRAALHVVAGRKTDHLTFEFHREVASRVSPGESLEGFFASLHRASQMAAAAWEKMATAVRLENGRRPASFVSGSPADGILAWCDNGESTAAELQAILAETDGTSPSRLTRAVGELLSRRIPLAPLLRTLYQMGLTGLLLPELEAVAHQVHYDARHSFTTAIHCIETLRVFEDLWLGALEREEPHLARIAGAAVRPGSIRVAALCHDLGKVQGVEAHERAGAEIARRVALRFGLSEDEGEEASRLVASHHALPRIAFGEDLEDPAAWERARAAARGPAGIDAMVALAFADLAATNPRSWSGFRRDWARDLLLTLRARAGEADGPGLSRVGRIREAVRIAAEYRHLGGIDTIWGRVPPRQALQTPPDLLAQQLSLALQLGSLPVVWKIESRHGGLTEILAALHASPRILSSVTGSLTAAGFDILSFQVHSWGDGTVHLWLRAAHPHGPPPAGQLAERLTTAITGERPAGHARSSGLRNPREDATPVQTRVRLTAGDNPFYSVLEVRCRDRRGLIRDLASALEGLHLTVEYALVTTHGPMAQDVFHLKDIFGGRIEGLDKVRALLRAVEKVAGGNADGDLGS